MEIILNYLDSMFAKLPDTEEVKKAKSEMASMMEDKYVELKAEGKSENEAIGTVISEFGSIDELAGELNLTSKPGAQSFDDRGDAEMEESAEIRRVGIDEAEGYIQNMAEYGKRIGLGVMMCIWSPIPLLVFATRLKAEIVGVAGVVVLLAIVAVAVGIFITTGIEMSRYNYLSEEFFVLESSARVILEKRRDEARIIFGKRIAFGVGLCIIGAGPLILTAALNGSEGVIGLGASLLLLIVSAGIYQFIRWGMPFGCYDQLLRKDDYQHWKKSKTLTDKIAGVYWPLVVAIYLGYSFITNDWGRSWIIWPVAALLFGAIAGVCSAVSKEE